MTNDAVVTKLLPHNRAEVVVSRLTACGGNCGSCEGCISAGEVKTVAFNRIGARPGQRVVIESKSSAVFGAVIMTYVVPLLLFLLGYILACAAGAGGGVCILASFIGLALGALLLVSQKKKYENIKYNIIK